MDERRRVIGNRGMRQATERLLACKWHEGAYSQSSGKVCARGPDRAVIALASAFTAVAFHNRGPFSQRRRRYRAANSGRGGCRSVE